MSSLPQLDMTALSSWTCLPVSCCPLSGVEGSAEEDMLKEAATWGQAKVT